MLMSQKLMVAIYLRLTLADVNVITDLCMTAMRFCIFPCSFQVLCMFCIRQKPIANTSYIQKTQQPRPLATQCRGVLVKGENEKWDWALKSDWINLKAE